uniref:uncharacterized protein LOC130477894 n=1 Tax=Euleptes europaea TaxID=460621 RepID=UPI0025400B6D|nr:uncharacterized protein LOC130477894 [Euleptes europaea]
MGSENLTRTSGFVLLGISTKAEHQGLFFPLFLSIYLLTLLGNLMIILLIRSDARLLHTPMYFFLSHLSLADLGFASTTVPKALENLLSHNKTITYWGCLTQMYFFIAFGITDSFLLASMAYDRYVAICHPLRYPVLMSHKHCLLLVTGSWLLAHLHSLVHTLLMARLSFCASREIPHFFCDVQPLLRLSCTSTQPNELLAFTEGSLVIMGPFLFIVVSYILILVAILKIPSAAGKHKAFSTCGSHLGAVSVFYGTVIAVYIQPSSTYSITKDRMVAVLYTMVTPMLNPFIYSLRNEDVMGAMKREDFLRGHTYTVFSAVIFRSIAVESISLKIYIFGEHVGPLEILQSIPPHTMERENRTVVSEFILLSISSRQDWNRLLFPIFLIMYTIIVLGNLTIVLAIRMDGQLLQIPMYFLLSNLSLVDICFTTATVPQLLANMLSGVRKISYKGCLAQMYFFIAFGITDSFLLASMAVDRYVAICRPLHYSTVMSNQICFLLVAGSWLVSHLHSLLHTALMSRLSFCASNQVSHFFCDVFPLLKISCSDTHLNALVVHTEGAVVVNSALVVIVLSYVRILVVILRIPSTQGKKKAFSTCGSHLTVVALFYGTVIWVYFQPSSSFSAEKDTLAAIMYTMVTPMLNPFIYTLRNDKMKEALRRLFGRKGN